MVTTTAESMHMIGILLRYVSKQKAYSIVSDMELEIADTTENTSLRDSIRMVREYLDE
jgi:hypothetical protein